MTTDKATAATEYVNEVRLVGRVSAAPERRVLPSGDALLAFRLVIDRDEKDGRGRRTVDVLDCVVRGGRLQRTMGGWGSGAIRRRFFRATRGAVSRVEIDVRSGRRLRRTASA